MRNGFCYLVDKLPSKFGKVTIDTRTSSAISCLLKCEEEGWNEAEKLEFMSQRLFGASIESVCEINNCRAEDVSNFIGKYISGAPEVKTWEELNGKDEPKPQRKGNKVFDFVQDSASIIASFRCSYSMSLQEVCDLHWWEFLALFQNLPSEVNAFTSIQRIRDMKPEKNDSAERRAEISKAKKSVALKDTRSPEQKAEDRKGMFNNIDL